jgi:hypothetical protein
VAGVAFFRLALLALDADQRTKQDGDGEIACRGKKLLFVHRPRPKILACHRPA